MNLLTGEASTSLFGGEMSPAIEHLIERAREAPRDQAAAILWTAAVGAPGCLPVHYLLYKLHASLGELGPALRAASTGLAMAAQAAGLPTDWRTVQPGDADFNAPGPARFWLFTLKALAFIHLRRHERDTAAGFIAQIGRLDPDDQIGASVTRTLLQHSGDSETTAT
ncbi:MAG: hypothetical protein IV088_01305 [Hydrogenophaga sp.]|uniref:hypothetical protein n=1 Tax=Hydrogenophaga sp. TaxID=1904254 RepID=UPI0025C44975|nr:hypothetical protein [Hydrogenophaga sp.]MBT9549458.1 hypothetical protein [Hydrogenophaga sp.]